jgi:hypothetical protein
MLSIGGSATTNFWGPKYKSIRFLTYRIVFYLYEMRYGGFP